LCTPISFTEVSSSNRVFGNNPGLAPDVVAAVAVLIAQGLNAACQIGDLIVGNSRFAKLIHINLLYRSMHSTITASVRQAVEKSENKARDYPPLDCSDITLRHCSAQPICSRRIFIVQCPRRLAGPRP
jgi:hypothetical protein